MGTLVLIRGTAVYGFTAACTLSCAGPVNAPASVLDIEEQSHLDRVIYATLQNSADHFGLNVEVNYSDSAQSPSARCGVAVEGDMNGWVDLNRRDMLRFWEQYGDSGVAGVVIHEMSHIVTCALVQAGKVYQRDYELLADCLTGDYMGSYHPNADLSDQRRMWADLGDFEIHSWGHHGLPEQRHNAFIAGFLNRVENRTDNAVDATVQCLIPMGYSFNR